MGTESTPRAKVVHGLRRTLRIHDIDGVLVKFTICDENGTYDPCGEPNQEEIDKLNAFYDAGDHIVLWTARSSEYRKTTEDHINSLGIKFHQLFMDKDGDIVVTDDNEVNFKVNLVETVFATEGVK